MLRPQVSALSVRKRERARAQSAEREASGLGGCFRYGGFLGFLGSFAEQGYARHYRHHADAHDNGERVVPYDDADERGQKGADTSNSTDNPNSVYGLIAAPPPGTSSHTA